MGLLEAAPEQVRGQDADHRADIFALGAVLFEMLTGRRAFQRDTPADTMSAILSAPAPDLSSSSVIVSPALDRIVQRCLEKQPSARFKSADDLAFALENASGAVTTTAQQASPSDSASRSAPRESRGRRGVIAAGAVAALVASAALGGLVTSLVRGGSIETAKPVMRLQVALPDGLTLVPAQVPALSPDGSQLAVVAVDEATGRRAIYVRALASVRRGSWRARHARCIPSGRPTDGALRFSRTRGSRLPTWRMAPFRMCAPRRR